MTLSEHNATIVDQHNRQAAAYAALLAEDARSGEDRLGFQARFTPDGALMTCYTTSTFVWRV